MGPRRTALELEAEGVFVPPVGAGSWVLQGLAANEAGGRVRILISLYGQVPTNRWAALSLHAHHILYIGRWSSSPRTLSPSRLVQDRRSVKW